MSEATDERSRFSLIKRERTLKAIGGVISTIVFCQLAFASFVYGHQQGPKSISSLELIIGIVFALMIGVGLSLPMVRRRVELGSDFKMELAEGRHKRRVVMFDDHLTIDQEIVMLSTVDMVELKKEALVLRYRDPRFEGRLLRELEGDKGLLKRLQGELRRACEQLAVKAG